MLTQANIFLIQKAQIAFSRGRVVFNVGRMQNLITTVEYIKYRVEVHTYITEEV